MTKVVFRKWHTGGDIVIALFPRLPDDVNGYFCQSYLAQSGFSGADYDGIIQNSSPAKPEEYQDIFHALSNIFGDEQLEIAQKASRHDRDRRRELARTMWGNLADRLSEDPLSNLPEVQIVDEQEPYFDRFDICEAHDVLEADYNSNGWLKERPSNQRRRMSTGVQLHRMGFKSNSVFEYEDLSENGKAIYRELVKRYNLPWEGEDV